jgi:hypothetical protein
VEVEVRAEPGQPSIAEGRRGGRLEVAAGEEVRLTCESQGGSPPAELRWVEAGGGEVPGLAGEEVLVTRREDGVTFRTVSVIKLRPERNMRLECWAESPELGVRRETGLEVAVLRPPSVTVTVGGAEGEAWVRAGEVVEVECAVGRQPWPREAAYSWWVAGRPVPGAGAAVLVLGPAGEEREGTEVRCRAETRAGRGEGGLLLRVALPPRITLQPGLALAGPGAAGRLECGAEGRPAPALVWVRAETGEPVGLGPVLELAVTPETEGEYVCRALGPGTAAAESRRGRLALRGPPAVLALEAGPEGALGTVLHCAATSPGAGTQLTWLRADGDPAEGEVVEAAGALLLHTSYLLLPPGQPAATFTCRVTSSEGEAARSITVGGGGTALLPLLPALLGAALLLLLLLLLARHLQAYRSAAQMERAKQRQPGRSLARQNISYIADSGEVEEEGGRLHSVRAH